MNDDPTPHHIVNETGAGNLSRSKFFAKSAHIEKDERKSIKP